MKKSKTDDFSNKRLGDECFNSSIAIIDDLESNRSFLEHLARRLPDVKQVSVYSSATEALRGFEKAPPDVVITDFNMPGMNAVEFLKEFRQRPERQDIPVIVISSQNESENRHQALLSGATDFLMVPFDTFEFQARARNLLRLSLHQKSLKSKSVSLHSELVETRKSSLETQHRFTSIIDSVPALVFALDENRECVFANTFCFDFLGISPDAGLAKVQFLAEKVIDQNESVSGKPTDLSHEICLTGKDGQEHVFLIMPRRIEIGEAGRNLVVYSGIEISQLKLTEHSLRRAKDDAEAANRAKSAFLSNMTHEIRTPLNAIIGFTDAICNELHGPIGSEIYKSYLLDIQSSANHLLSVINEILDFSQIESQRYVVNIASFFLKDCLEEIQTLTKQQLKSRKNTLIIDEIPDLELRSDPQKLRQVLLNIVTNANKATQSGTVRILIRHDRRAEQLILTIADDGIGMDEREMALAVTEFGRAMTSAFVSNGHSGTGLGLPISIRLMKLLGGRVEIESQKDVGTTVRIFIPTVFETRHPETLEHRVCHEAGYF
jgi:signal transduction histidine kinase/DNA-binding NarL/FixJ family response regulator